jgi:hypothetical protein
MRADGWSVLDSVVTCYWNRVVDRCVTDAIIERRSGERRQCTVTVRWPVSSDGKARADTRCDDTTLERFVDRGGAKPYELTSDPPQQVVGGQHEWRIAGGKIIGCAASFGRDLVCGSPTP